MRLTVGDRVRVPFSGKSYTGVVSAVDVRCDVAENRVKQVQAAEPGLGRIGEKELELWRFIADYYLCTVGEVYKAAYPASKVASEQVRARLLARQELLRTQEEARCARLRACLLERLEAKERQLSARHGENVRIRLQEERARIAAELSALDATLARIREKALLSAPSDSLSAPELQARLSDLTRKDPLRSFPAGKPILYQAAKREESYLCAIARTLLSGRNVLVLVPEIQAAAPMASRLSDALGADLLLVHHSELSAPNRRRIAERVRSGQSYVLLGTRSSLFLPHSELGLIIVDNEYAAAYKQEEPAPRYNARDCAVMLAGLHGARVVLGAAAPSLESLYNTRTGRYTLFAPDTAPASTERIDIRAEKNKNGMVGPLSRKLLARIGEALRTDYEQIALIRGYDKAGEAAAVLSESFPGEEGRFLIITQQEAIRTDLSSCCLVAALQADAFFPPDDFRGDERALQLLSYLAACSSNLVIQTARATHPVFTMRDASALLQERKDFHLPPYTRLADICLADVNAARLSMMARRLQDRLGLTPQNGRKADERIFRVTLPRDRSLREKKAALKQAAASFESDNHYAGHIYIDVDPL